MQMPAVYVENHAGDVDVVGGLAGQKGRGCGDVLGLPGLSHGVLPVSSRVRAR